MPSATASLSASQLVRFAGSGDAGISPARAEAIAKRYFDAMEYLVGDLAMGTLRNRSGAKMCALTADFFRGLHRALTEETGEAWPMVLYRCGLIWGERVAARLEREFAEHFGKPVAELDMALFTSLMEEFFASHGWGRLRVDYSAINGGVVQIDLENPVYAPYAGRSEQPVEALTAGLVASLFTYFSGAELLCHQTECVSLGDPLSRFVVSEAKRLDPVPDWVAERVPHDEIVKRLVAAATPAE